MQKLKSLLKPTEHLLHWLTDRAFLVLASLSSLVGLSSCSEGKMIISSVGYQSIRTTFRQPDASKNKIPNDAEIILAYTVNENGRLNVGIKNNTDEIMVIDQTMSFFINNGRSISYYDPTVKSTTITDLSSKTKGGNVNLGAVDDILGMGGTIGKVLNRINIGGSSTTGTSVENTTIIADQPKVSIGPRGSAAMNKAFPIDGIGISNLKDTNVASVYTSRNSPCTFSVCISYSLDGGENFKKITTDFYMNSKIVVPVLRKGMVNESLRSLYSAKTDALNENLWLLHFNNNVPNTYKTQIYGCLYDYQ